MNLTIKKRDGSPDFVIGSGGVRYEDLKNYVNSKGYVNFDLLRGKDNSGYYLKINEYDTSAANKQDEVIPF